MKLALPAFLFVILILLGAQTFSFWREKKAASRQYEEIMAEFDRVEQDQEKLKAELEYLSNPINLEKELRARFNLKKPGEEMIILVPESSSSRN